MMNQNKTPLFDGIENLINSKPAYFCIPGHRLDRGISTRWTDKVGTDIFKYDVTETFYTDDLHCPEKEILEAEELLTDLYKADKSYFLVNGTTCGNEAMIVAAVHAGEKILVARNAHKSANMGLIISGATPVYVMPKTIDEWGIQGEILPEDVEKAFKKDPDIKAFFIVSPSYYGVVSDLEKIAKICHEHKAMLLVDEAHGGHTYFHEKLPKGAMECGADMCVQSMHKVTGALTQASVLHIKSKLVNRKKVEDALHLVQSTSPSYLLMTSLDLARYELAANGHDMMEKALELADYAREKINKVPGFCCMGTDYQKDRTRIVLSAKKIGISGFDLAELLLKENILFELVDPENVLAIVTYANTKEDMDRLVEACKKVSDENENGEEIKSVYSKEFPNFPEQKLTPREAYFAETKEVELKEAAGMVAAEMVAPYPPGIPVVYPGEVITKEILDYLEPFTKDERHMHGARNGKIQVVVNG